MCSIQQCCVPAPVSYAVFEYFDSAVWMLKIELKYIFNNPQVSSISLNMSFKNFRTFTKAECNIINIKAPLSNTFKLRLHQNISDNMEVVLSTVDLLTKQNKVIISKIRWIIS